MGKSKSKSNPTKSVNTPHAGSKTRKSGASKAAQDKKTGPPKRTPTLFSGNEGVQLRSRIDRFFDKPRRQVSGSPSTTYSTAHREAVATKNRTTKATTDTDNGAEGGDSDVAEEGDTEEGEDTGEDGEEDSQESADEGSGEDVNGDAGDAEQDGEELPLDEEEEREMRTVKSKGKATTSASSARSLRFGGVVMLSTPFPKGGKASKPSRDAIGKLAAMGLALSDADGFVIPAHATYEEVDQILGDLLPTPIDHLQSHLEDDDDTPVWELLTAEYRNLHRTNVEFPTASNIRATFGEGRSIASKVLFICPTFPFSKKVLAKWRSGTAAESPKPEISVPEKVTSSRKRKRESPNKPEDDENCDDTDHEHKKMTKKLRVISPVDDDHNVPVTPHKKTTRSTDVNSQGEIDLTCEDNHTGLSGGPLRERQVWEMTDTIFLLNSPDKDFDPYVNPDRYFHGL
ncbi:hypothetical protein FRC01_004664 [Tulasnella sp. 417]|nr:hypothetical protein FRC01_004664 [Tulasnella sp. 417]